MTKIKYEQYVLILSCNKSCDICRRLLSHQFLVYFHCNFDMILYNYNDDNNDYLRSWWM